MIVMVITTIRGLTGYAQGTTVVTVKNGSTGYAPQAGETPMDALFVLLASLAAIVAIDLTTIDWSGGRPGR
jgi:hypothetical protein